MSGLLVLAAPSWVPYLGRKVAWLDVQRVEISGATLVAPHDVLKVSGIRAGNSIFDERDRWQSAIEAHPVISDATISWRLPSTLRIRVVEERPVALVAGETLAPATASGEILPLDPTAVPLDLPIVPLTPDDPEIAGSIRAALAEAGRLAALDPLLMSDVSEIRPATTPGAVVLVHPLGEIVLPAGVEAHRLKELEAVLADVSQRFRTSETAPAARRPFRFDLRFDGQIVVRHPPPRELS